LRPETDIVEKVGYFSPHMLPPDEPTAL
jgi:hypothetical protein